MQRYKITAIINIGKKPVSRLKFMDVDFYGIYPVTVEDIKAIRDEAIRAANTFTENLIGLLGNIRLQIHSPMIWIYGPNGSLSEFFNPFEKG